jgi:hypothetical protein
LGFAGRRRQQVRRRPFLDDAAHRAARHRCECGMPAESKRRESDRQPSRSSAESPQSVGACTDASKGRVPDDPYA